MEGDPVIQRLAAEVVTGTRKEITLNAYNPSHTVYTIHISFPVPDTD
jgi:hypothetical protein